MQEELTFEEAVSRLEAIVTRMETGELTLDESLRCFREAVELSRYCAAKLDAAEKEIRVLTEAGGLQAERLSWIEDGDTGEEPQEPFAE